MEWLYPVLQAVQVISALAVIGLVLLQHGRGADMGSAFGAGSSGSVFGAAGAANFLSRATRWAAIIFFVVTAGLAWAVYHPKQKEIEAGSVMQGFESVVPGAPGQIGRQDASDDTGTDASVPVVPGANDDTGASSSAVPGVPSSGSDTATTQEQDDANADSGQATDAASEQSNSKGGQAADSADDAVKAGGEGDSDTAADAESDKADSAASDGEDTATDKED